ncbi:type II toxin-antitoxin system VapC family toxin [Streptoalloteichus hindustanus]|uniref:Ribonuclease VapC n=1 Tax=Streptoalloteichus hindustanus TaxID=2017 RepID=A0A1M4YGW5_STRHI|nr:type II toxin-antitoxin system VapC family toxin [Streptoalloteichus hindustanus]SHF04971.1 hypothetical protein SAMN05444320_102354 [Streptoalloteichus hindustanus]
MIYLDSSAIVKLIRQEEHSGNLVTWLNDSRHVSLPLVSSALAEIEVPRAIRRCAPAALPGVPAALARLYLLEIDIVTRQTAAAYPQSSLRSLDVIHLATAQTLAGQPGADLTAFVTYDKRLADTARSVQLPVVEPGIG